MLTKAILALVLAFIPSLSWGASDMYNVPDDQTFSVSRTGVGTLWSSCQLSDYQTVVFYLTSNVANKVQMQTAPDVTFANEAPLGLGQSLNSVSLVGQDAVSAAAPPVFPLVWPKVGPCMRLQVLSGADIIAGNVVLSLTRFEDWSQSYTNQVFSSDFSKSVASLPKVSTQIIAASGIVQRVWIISTDATQKWCNFGNAAVDGQGIPLKGIGKSFLGDVTAIGGVNNYLGKKMTASAPRDAVFCKTDSGEASNGSLTVVWH